ncbi:MAG: hypothetical protein FJ398_14400 [Verrucomicrobia bacterium]|nr:hypothetical protein [Verrucomicrobiota bacterium]
MKHPTRSLLSLAALSVLLSLNAAAQSPPPGYVNFGKFAPPTSGEFVEVHVKNNLISMAARLAEKIEPEVAQLLRGLHLVRVNVIGLTEENRADVEKRI